MEFDFDETGIERLVTVAGDLEFLGSLNQDRLLSHTEVRLVAGILRRLLIENQIAALMKQVRNLPAPPTLIVEATNLDASLNLWPDPSWIWFAFAGGDTTETTARHSGVIMARVPKSAHGEFDSPEAFFGANQLPLNADTVKMPLSAFLAGTSLAAGTNEIGLVRISRKTVIQYMANKRGGVHFDPSRNLQMKNANKSRREAEYQLLDHGMVRVGHLRGPEYEIMAMGRVIATARWATALIEMAEKLAPADFNGDPAELKLWSGLKEADGTGWVTSRFEVQTAAEGKEIGG